MKLLSKLLTLLLVLSTLAACLAGCGTDPQVPDGPETPEFVDYASTVKFDPNSGRAHTTATVKTFVDGDTTHFHVPTSVISTGLLKARYLAINTPESTGKIEPWGKKASNYTKTALSNATSIIIESNDGKWNADSTGDRYLVWVWYKTANDAEYRNLNLEILQEGLAVTSKVSDTYLAEVATQIAYQSNVLKLHVFSKEKDPDFYYGSAIPMTLRELKTNIEAYRDISVSFEGVVTRNVNQTAYVEEYDEETGLYFGIQVYYGHNLVGQGQEILEVGNRVRIVGSVQYYETGGTYQISDITYKPMKPDHEANIQLISGGHSAAYQEMTVSQLLNEQVTLEITTTNEDGDEITEQKAFDVGFLTMHGSVSLKNLTVKSVFVTTNDESSMKGALSITCTDASGNEIVLRTIVLYDENQKLIDASYFPVGTVLDVQGVVDVYKGVYQVKVFHQDDVTFH